MRRDASQPWLADLLLTPSRDGLWVFKKDGRVTLPLDRVGDERDGIRFLRPQVALLHMAHLGRSKDDADFRSLLPRLGPDDRAWLDEALALWRPDRHSRQALR